jgi:hypothetical protein
MIDLIGPASARRGVDYIEPDWFSDVSKLSDSFLIGAAREGSYDC